MGDDEWPDLFKGHGGRHLGAAGPIWLGDNSSRPKRSSSASTPAQRAQQGRAIRLLRKVGGCLITGNEDGIKHCAMDVLYSLQHLGYPFRRRPTPAGSARPGRVQLRRPCTARGPGFDNDFTNRNTTFMTWNLMHLARMLKDAGGIPAYGNQRSEWDGGARFDFANPEYR